MVCVVNEIYEDYEFYENYEVYNRNEVVTRERFKKAAQT